MPLGAVPPVQLEPTDQLPSALTFQLAVIWWRATVSRTSLPFTPPSDWTNWYACPAGSAGAADVSSAAKLPLMAPASMMFRALPSAGVTPLNVGLKLPPSVAVAADLMGE